MLIKDFVKQTLNGKRKQVNGCFIIFKHNQVFEQYWYENNKLLYGIPDEIMNMSIDDDVYSYATEDWINFNLYPVYSDFESLNRAKVKEIENEIEKGINEAIEQGRYECTVCPFTSMSQEVRARITEDLTKLGYKVKIEDNDVKYKNAPSEQRPWYDNITIDWSKEEQK